MKFAKIIFTAEADISFTREEVELLMRLSASHYDGVCRQAGQVGGFLYGMNNRFVVEVPEVVALGNTVELSFREIDTLCKILESAYVATKTLEHDDSFSLALQLRADLSDGLARLNAVAGLFQEIR